MNTTTVGTPLSQTFTIRNEGAADLTLGVTAIILPSGFSLTAAPASTIAPGNQSSFTIRLDATSSGFFSGQVSIPTNDWDENPFGFYFSGQVAGSGSTAGSGSGLGSGSGSESGGGYLGNVLTSDCGWVRFGPGSYGRVALSAVAESLGGQFGTLTIQGGGRKATGVLRVRTVPRRDVRQVEACRRPSSLPARSPSPATTPRSR